MVRTRSPNAITTIQNGDVRIRDQYVREERELEVMRWDHLYMIRPHAGKATREVRNILLRGQLLQCSLVSDQERRSTLFDYALFLEVAQNTRDRFPGGPEQLGNLFVGERNR